VPVIIRGAGAAKKIWDAWRNLPSTSRQDEMDQMCDERYAEDTETCNQVTKNKGSRAGRACHESAAERMAKCRKTHSDDNLPPLQTF
jgi:hypothetical protein